jgi:hypothetical protein
MANTPRDDLSPLARHRGWGRPSLAVVLVAIGALLAPVAVVASWTRIEITDTENFVATFAPLARDPAVQDFLSDKAVAAIDDSVDIPRLTSAAIDGITGLGTGPAATAALDSLKGAAAEGVQDIIQNIVSRYVASDAFAVTWAKALRLSHNQIIATLGSDPAAVIAADWQGTIGIRLGPIVERLKTVLVEKGMTFADQIPAVDSTIVIARSDVVRLATVVYSTGAVAGTWLPWLALSFLATGVVVARRRIRAIVRAMVALAFAMILLGSMIGVGRLAFLHAVAPIPSATAGSLYDRLVGGLSGATVAVAVFAAATALVAWLVGPFRTSRSVRALATAAAGRLRAAVRSRTTVVNGDDDGPSHATRRPDVGGN